MGRTGRWFLAVSAIVVLLGPSTQTVVAAPPVADRRLEPSTLGGSPTAFAERIAAAHPPAASAQSSESLWSLLELIALTVICAIVAAYYSSASTQRDDPSTSRPRRR